MNRFELFIENFLVYGLGGVIGKMLPFLILPVITRLLPNSYYMGLNDMSKTILSFAQAFAIVGMYDAMFRMFFEKDDLDYKKDICSSTLTFVLLTSFIVFLILCIFSESIAQMFFENVNYKPLVLVTALSVLFGSTNSIIAAPTRMENKRKVFLFTNFLLPAVSYSIAVFLLLRGEYVYALPVGNLLAAVSLELIFLVLNYRWFSIKRVRWDYIKIMLKIGLPLLPNFLIYWIFNSCDRIMISNILGIGAVGIYAVGAKFGQISQLIYTAFAGGWQYFAFYTMNDEDQVKLTSKVFEYLGTIALLASSGVMILVKILFFPLFGSAYKEAAVIVPYLFMAPLAQMLFQIVANQFLVVKKTLPSSIVLLTGAVVNIVLNTFLIPKFGIEGAAFSTLFGYVFSTAITVIVLQRMKLFQLPKRFLLILGSYIICFITMRFFCGNMGTSFAIVCLFFLWCILCYQKELKVLKEMMLKKK